MTDSYFDHRLQPLAPDLDVTQRMTRLAELGLGTQPVRIFDDVARHLAEQASAEYAMVNFITDREQYFAGLHAPSGEKAEALQAAQATVKVAPSRTMRHDQGYCPHVIRRRLSLVLDDVCQNPRFAVNPVVNEMHIRSYMGAPLIDDKTGVALGTVCAVSTSTSGWGRQGLDLIKATAAEVMAMIVRAERGA